MLRYWNRLPREISDVPTMEAFKTRLVGVLGSFLAILVRAGGLEMVDS